MKKAKKKGEKKKAREKKPKNHETKEPTFKQAKRTDHTNPTGSHQGSLELTQVPTNSGTYIISRTCTWVCSFVLHCACLAWRH